MTDSSATAASIHRKIEKSAAALETSAHEQVDSADRRTELAADRTILAAERTYAAWVQTGLAALASGVGVRALLGDVVAAWLSRTTGAMLALFAAFCFVAAVWREIAPSVRQPTPRVRCLPGGVPIAVNGFLMLVALMACVGIVVTP